MAPRIDFATAADGTRIAWTEIGRGPTLVLMPGVPLSNLEAEWRIPTLDRAYRRLAEHVRLVQYDGRGTGRSQRDVQDVSLAAQMLDLDAVLGSAHAHSVVLLGFYHSSMTALAWAARHPDRVRGVIIFGGGARGWDPMQEAGTQALISLIERDWDTFAESATHAWLGWPDDAEGRLAADWFRTSTSPAIARATLQAASETDVGGDLGRIDVPTLVLHRADATVIPIATSQALAESLPAGRLEILPGSSASLFFEATDLVVDRLASFTLDPVADAPVAPARQATRTGAGALSPREREVLRLIARGETNGQIAAALGLSVNTVERHVSNAYRKVDVGGRAEATAWAIRNGIA